jgi:hypothetical protein
VSVDDIIGALFGYDALYCFVDRVSNVSNLVEFPIRVDKYLVDNFSTKEMTDNRIVIKSVSPQKREHEREDTTLSGRNSKKSKRDAHSTNSSTSATSDDCDIESVPAAEGVTGAAIEKFIKETNVGLEGFEVIRQSRLTVDS